MIVPARIGVSELTPHNSLALNGSLIGSSIQGALHRMGLFVLRALFSAGRAHRPHNAAFELLVWFVVLMLSQIERK